ncbi:MAG: rRNA maturation RNase YbeY [Gammaproteobacteria bacterium]|nr:rRNA maturation RNase YbeY [Gammaproteobacteria bacterium]
MSVIRRIRRVKIDLALQVACEASDLPGQADFERWVAAALEGRRERAELTVRIVDDAESQYLNRTWRHHDRPANVLSFPVGPAAGLPPRLRASTLGDLVVCAPVVSREAAEQGKPASAHWAHLVVHGTLHLLGYDHMDRAKAAVMEALEVEILARLGYMNPYADLPLS